MLLDGPASEGRCKELRAPTKLQKITLNLENN